MMLESKLRELEELRQTRDTPDGRTIALIELLSEQTLRLLTYMSSECCRTCTFKGHFKGQDKQTFQSLVADVSVSIYILAKLKMYVGILLKII